MTGRGLAPTIVKTTYLELRSAEGIVSARRPADATLVRAEIPSPDLNRFFYTAVGSDWFWRDRLPWAWSDWHRHLARPGYETWYATVRGTPAGYFELDGTAPPDVEIAYFGLLPEFTGRGLGGWLLEQAARRGFEGYAAGGGRVWVHTCTLDGPTALANYLARGFVAYRVEESLMDLPSPPEEPWPGAARPSARAP